ncbi:hypothetical protein ACFLT7_04120 [candidate division KSB1 bacterium]
MTVILVVLTFIIIVSATTIAERRRKRRALEPATGQPDIQWLAVNDFRIPEGILFHPGHTWALVGSESDKVQIGIDDFIRKLVDVVDEVVIPKPESRIEIGDRLLLLKTGTRSIEIPSPVSGIVMGGNASVVGRPSMLGQKNLVDEWLIELKPLNLSADFQTFNVTDKARAWLSSELDRLKDFLHGQSHRPEMVGASLADGGEPVPGAICRLDPGGIKQFEKEFLGVA